MPKINFEKIVNADRAKVFEIATDYKSFQKTMPQYFPSINIKSSRDNVSVVEEHIRLAGRELVLMAKHVIEHPSIHEVFVIGGDGKGSYIIEKYEEIPKGTKITLHANLKLKGVLKISGFFGKAKITNSLSKIMDEIAKIAEN